VTGSGAFWLINVFRGSKGDIVHLIASLFLIPIFIGLDQWVQRLLKIASGELPQVIDLSGEDKPETAEATEESKRTDIKHFAPLIIKIFRFVLIALLFFIILGLWGIDLSFGRIFAAEALQIIMVVIAGFVVWEFAKSRIDRKLKEEMPDTDEEMGPVMLDKIKSQGVRELDDSAMIMRVKFKTIPGEQFVVRREVFRMMQESFRENGIEFAHRNATVYLPPEEKSGGAEEDAKKEESEGRNNKKLAEAAAAAAAIQAEEDAKLKAGPPKK
jgi:small-conductance mechanosensitive channel